MERGVTQGKKLLVKEGLWLWARQGRGSQWGAIVAALEVAVVVGLRSCVAEGVGRSCFVGEGAVVAGEGLRVQEAAVVGGGKDWGLGGGGWNRLRLLFSKKKEKITSCFLLHIVIKARSKSYQRNSLNSASFLLIYVGRVLLSWGTSFSIHWVGWEAKIMARLYNVSNFYASPIFWDEPIIIIITFIKKILLIFL